MDGTPPRRIDPLAYAAEVLGRIRSLGAAHYGRTPDDDRLAHRLGHAQCKRFCENKVAAAYVRAGALGTIRSLRELDTTIRDEHLRGIWRPGLVRNLAFYRHELRRLQAEARELRAELSMLARENERMLASAA